MLVLFSASAEIVVDFLEDVSHMIKCGTGFNYLEWNDAPILAGAALFVLGVLIYSAKMQELLSKVFKHEKLIVIAALIVASLALGYSERFRPCAAPETQHLRK
jgi:hypothetical protein